MKLINRDTKRRAIKAGISEEIANEIGQVALSYTVDAYTVVIASVLNDKLGFGRVRLMRMLSLISERFDAVKDGYVDVEDLRKDLAENSKVTIL